MATQKEFTQKESTMKDQHKHIKGYRDLSKAEIDAINLIKEKAEEVKTLCENLTTSLSQDADTYPDVRWLAIGITHLQQGFMAVVRSIAKPSSF